MEQKEGIIRIFPNYIRERWKYAFEETDKLQEIRLAAGSPVRFIILGKEKFISEDGMITDCYNQACRLTELDIEEIVKNVCHFSLYAFENEIRQGFLTVPGGHRIGMAGQVILNEEDKIRNIKYIRFLNIRISHQIIGAANDAMAYLYENKRFLNTIIVAPPGCGKTTMLRDIVRQVSGGNKIAEGMQVGVVDERSEIAGSFMGIPQNDVGIRTDVLDACPKGQGMMMLMRSMAPAVVAVDEIGSMEDLQAVFQIITCGSSIVATMHGNSISDAEEKIAAGKAIPESSRGSTQILRHLFDRYIILEKINGKCQIKHIYGNKGNILK